ncbi:hypothetical protein ABT236_18705 [Streptomyces sp. NPDC001523]|uniref:hypothetical protein n=1 Tax=Streptomyces sp. NPDC001523 TaxID=3154383 RepID=UPI0033238D04
MNRNTVRIATVSALAALTLGAGAGLAQASEAPQARPAATAQATLSASDARALLANPAVSAELKAEDAQTLRAVANGTATEVQARAAIGGAVKALFNLLKKYGGKILSGAYNAAKAGWGKFRSYMDGLPWYHPVRIAWVAAGAEAQYQLYTYIRSLVV